jgi:predicted cupin superfamily sugar epimerase
MQNRITELIEQFNLQAHPEGGYYSEEYRSEITMENTERQLMTSIYFLLPSEHVSHFHRIKSDELWFFHEGSPISVHTLDENGHTENLVGNNFIKGENPQFLVKANTVFGSCVNDADSYSFVSCVVSPGFDFRDHEMFTSEQLLGDYSDFEKIIKKLTIS